MFIFVSVFSLSFSFYSDLLLILVELQLCSTAVLEVDEDCGSWLKKVSFGAVAGHSPCIRESIRIDFKHSMFYTYHSALISGSKEWVLH